jgi:hypothetical protein
MGTLAGPGARQLAPASGSRTRWKPAVRATGSCAGIPPYEQVGHGRLSTVPLPG